MRRDHQTAEAYAMKPTRQLPLYSPNNWQGLSTLMYQWCAPLLFVFIAQVVFMLFVMNWSEDAAAPTQANPIVALIWTGFMIVAPLVAFINTVRLRVGPLRVAITQTRFNRGLFFNTKYVLYFTLYGFAFMSVLIAKSAVDMSEFYYWIWSASEDSATVSLIVLAIVWISIIAFATRQIRMIYRNADRVCPSCGYDRKGEVTTTCPECGYAEKIIENAA